MASDWYKAVPTNSFFRVIYAFAALSAVKTRRRDSESSSTSSSSSGIIYEVFINFRGKDTREDFTDLLQKKLKKAGIGVFKDNENLPAGEEIDQGLKDAIKRSRISIAIFSKNYASSKSCLMELVQMWECKRLAGQTIIPIFYDVTPDDVKHQVGNFATSFEKHEKVDKVDAKTINLWRQVLQRSGGLKGFEKAKINGGRVSDLLEEVLTCVMELLKKNDQPVTDKLVDIDFPVQKVMSELGVGYNHGQAIKACVQDVRVIAICGMPGIGKTTLAKVVFNKMYKLFDRYSFLEDINSQGIKVSQELLIADLQREKCASPLRSANEGIKIIGSRFSNTKVLIVLDGVRHIDQIKALVGKPTWFGPGSRIIMTTNRKDVFIGLKNEEATVKEHKVEPMKYHHALQLFRKHAFQGDALQDVSEYFFFAGDIVKALGGHPLAIELWARYLRKKNIEIWKDILKLLNENKRDQVEQRVKDAFMAGYNSSNNHAKEIFLDVACFFIGKDWRIPYYMWSDCDCYPARGLNDLGEMYLLEIGENNELRMHNLLRDIGRELVESEVLHKRSRIWNHNEALSILGDGKGTEHVQGISLTVEEGCTVSFTWETFHKMPNLRYLRLDWAIIQGTSENLLQNLRWLEWQACHSISELDNMHLQKLVILDLSRSLVTGDSQDCKRIMEKMTGLKVLNLEGCTRLPASLNFPAPIKLERLILTGCTQLAQIGPFISKLENLTSLNLRKCSRIKQLPQKLGCMKSLKELLIDETGIHGICFQEGSLECLEILSACRCEELKDISTIGRLRELKSLALDESTNIDWDPVSEFPRKLRTLSLRNCRTFNELPQSIGKLTQLEEMDLSDTGIKEMPPSVEKLSNLKTLKMERTHLQNFPKEIVKLGKLEEIGFSGCRNLGGQVCCDMSGLSSLRNLELSSSKVAGLPQSICRLSCLQTLDVLKCNQLQALPKLPSSLVRLRWGSENMTVPDLSNLTSLKTLCLIDAQPPNTPNIGGIARLPSLEILELSLPNVTNLPGNFSALTQLRELTLSYMKELDLTQLPLSPSLWTLCLKHCKIRQPKFSSLPHLSKLELDDCDLAGIDSLEDLKLLQLLKISHCSSLRYLNGLEKIRCLRKVKVSDSPLVILPELLKRVEVDRCDL